MTCNDPAHMLCPDCGGETCIVRGKYHPIHVPRLDAEGWPAFDQQTGELLFVDIPLPQHVVYHSVFDPIGLVEVVCDHGLADHPDGRKHRYGRSWVRSRYAVADGGIYGQCVIDRGEPVPADLVNT